MIVEDSFCAEMVEQGLFEVADLTFAKTIVKEEETALLSFIALLFAFTRLGHLCIEVGEEITPSLSLLGEKGEALAQLEREVRKGAAELPPHLVEELSSERERFEKPIGRWKNSYYLQRNWVLESSVLKELKRLWQGEATNVKPLYTGEIKGVNHGQEEGIRKALSQNFTLLTGGPGTGKTYTIARLVELFLQEEEGKVLIAAPTGKAVQELRKRFGSFPKERVRLGTLHALLGIREFADLIYGEAHFSEKLVIVDECSMIDVALWKALLKAIRGDARVVLVGDPHQLPPVETGTVYKELTEFFKAERPFSIASLEKSMRSESEEILNLASQVKRGEFTAQEKGAVSYFDLNDLALLRFTPYFPKPTKEPIDFSLLFQEKGRFQILSPLKNGPHSIEELNNFFWNFYAAQMGKGETWPVPILITKTSYRLNVTNGEMGFLLKKSPSLSLGETEEAIFLEENGEGKVRSILSALLPPFSLAYALSVHKSQGSEYDRVALFVPEGSEVFGREILYTGITRARKNLEIIGEKGVIKRCLQRTSEKFSGIGKRLRFE